MGQHSDTAASSREGNEPSPTSTLRASAPSATATLPASSEALDALFHAPKAPRAPTVQPPAATMRRGTPTPGQGSGAPVVHPADTNVDAEPLGPRPSALQTMAAPPRPSVIETMAPAPRPSVIETMAPAPRPSVIETMAPAQRPSADNDDPNATRAAVPASADTEASAVTGTVFRGSAPASSDEPSDTPSALRASGRPDAPDGVDRNLALARLQERMLGVQSEAVKIGRFIVIRKLGQGAMGIVYLAYDPKLDRKVALKLVDTSALGSEVGDAQVRLEREAKAAAALGHPNVVTVYDVGNQGEDVFLAMEFVEGAPLTDWMKQEHEWRETVRLFAEIARGLAAAHDAGLIHRDFKPDNVLMGEDGRPRVADFGLARPTEGWSARDAAKMIGDGKEGSIRALAIGSHDALVSTGEVCGTPAYMAPEQFAGIDVSAASDQFGFCASLYEALFGHRPFKGESVTELAVAVIENNREPLPSKHNVPKAVVSAVLQGLDPDVEKRHPSMHAVADRLEAALRLRTRNRILAGGAVLAVLGGGFGAQAATALDEQPCEAAQTDVEDTWNPQTRASLEASLTNANLPTAVVGEFDAFANKWTSQRVEACEATRVAGTQTDEVLGLRMACLDRAQMRLRVANESLTNGPTAPMLDSVEVALGDLDECGHIRSLQEENALGRRSEDTVEQQAIWTQLEGKIAFIRLNASAPPSVWQDEAKEVARLGREHHLDHAAAVGLRWVGAAAVQTNELDAAEAAFADALRWSATSQDRKLAPELLQAAGEVALLSGRYDQATERLNLAVAFSGRILDPDERRKVEQQAQLTLAEVHVRNEAPDRARQLAERLRDETPAPPPATRERILSTLGSSCRALGDMRCAVESHTKALEIAQSMPEVEPLELAGRYANVGLMHVDMGNAPESVKLLRKAAEIVEEAFDANHPMRGQLLSDIGGIQGAMMDPKDGERDLLAGLAIHEKNHGPDSPELVEALMDLNKTQMRLGKFDDAKAHGERAVKIVDASFEGNHPRRAEPRLPLSDAYAATGQFDQAAKVLREGLEILEGPKTHPMQRAEFQFALARALAPVDAEAAGEMAETATAGIADFEPGEPLREAIAGWRAEVLDAQPDEEAQPAEGEAEPAEAL